MKNAKLIILTIIQQKLNKNFVIIAMKLTHFLIKHSKNNFKQVHNKIVKVKKKKFLMKKNNQILLKI